MDTQKITEQDAAKVASMLLQIGAIRLNPRSPFKWSSGWNSPIYCDNRLSLSFPRVRSTIKAMLVNTVKSHYPEAEAIAGVATAGIPQGALMADAMDLPFLYVRSTPKGHGMENLIEGKAIAGQKVVVVEDLVSTGGSSLKAASALVEAGCHVLGMVAIFTYGFQQADKNFEQAGVPLVCLSNYSKLVEEALNQGYISEDEVDTLEAWRKAPGEWGVH